MKKMLKFELTRMLTGKGIIISLAIGIILCVWLFITVSAETANTMTALEQYGLKGMPFYPRTVYNSYIGLDYVYLPTTILYAIFPILVSLPLAATFYSDKKSGYIKNLLIKSERSKYFLAKFVSVFFSGMFVTGVILAFSFVLTAMKFPLLPPELITNTFTPNSPEQMWTSLYVNHPFIYSVLYSLIDMVFMGLFATIPLCLAVWINNSVSVVVIPFICYTAIHYILNSIGLGDFSPMGFLRPSQIFVNARFSIIIIEALIILILTLTTFVFIGRKKDVM
jgi:hypothetical protein